MKQTSVKIFYSACGKNDIETLRALLSDFNLKKLAKNPFEDLEVILEGMRKASFANLDKPANEAWCFLFTQYQKRLEQVLSNQDLFDRHRSEILLTIAEHKPDIAAIYLDRDFKKHDPTKLLKEQFNNLAYSNVLNALFQIATEPDIFKFAAKTLLFLAAREIKLGVYRGHYKALPILQTLFQNACTKTRVKLKTRKKYLEEFITEADNAQDYYRLVVLMKTLGVAADAFESGEYGYIEDDDYSSYIHFAVDSLMRYAGTPDENGLDLTAEKALNGILEATICEPEMLGAFDIPFKIFRGYLQSKKQWNIDPFFYLNTLNDFIAGCKEDTNLRMSKEDLHKLELRLEQLISLVCNREFIAEDFLLYRGAKKLAKVCEIGLGVDQKTQVELHERQSLAERLIFVGKSSLQNIDRGYPKATYLIANLGLVITDRPHQKEGAHRRIFNTIPIHIVGKTITGRAQNNRGHAEDACYEYLLKDENITSFIAQFRQTFNIRDKDHKVYAVVLDLHGTYDMCMSCSEKGLKFQDEFRQKLLKLLVKHNMKGLTRYPTQLPIIIRYSSDLRYHYPNSNDDRKRGVLMMTMQAGTRRDLAKTTTAHKIKYDLKRDIKHYGANLLIHGKENWHLLWDLKREQYANKALRLEAWTAFTTDNQHQRLTEIQKQIEYTQGGMVNTKLH